MESETILLTLVVVNLANIMESADLSLLPAVYKEIGATLHVDPTALGSLTSFRSFVEVLCYPFAAYLATRYNRARVIALGAFLWAATTFFVAISSTFLQVAISRGLNGIGLAIVAPAMKSLIADSTDDYNRGMAFGWLQLTGNLGSIIGSFIALLMASTSLAGIPGWRIAFHLVALISVVVGLLLLLFADDPHFPKSDGRVTHQSSTRQKPFYSEVKDLMKEAKSVIRIPSFQIIVAQGVFSSFPGSALSYATLWLELIGFSHVTTALLLTSYTISYSLGGLFGGKMGDILSKRLPNSGRIMLSQISTASAIPLAAILLLALPDDPSTAVVHGLVLFVMGFCKSWLGPATNNMDSPIYAEIVPEKSRTVLYALDRCFISILSSFAPTIVGVLAQHVYGYKPIAKGSSASGKIATDRENGASLAKALYSLIGVPMAISCLIYSFLYCTYPRDRERARMVALVESEMQQLEVDACTKEEYCGVVHVLESGEMNNGKESNKVDIDFHYPRDEPEIIDMDDNDEKVLLSHIWVNGA
ncbi:hypothetical protein RIF29_42314 [Crotalaria pallida]|uniref:Major facilitator superfamily (MFS) profile domain-containing protein n=1 Tax=Crotalaria pallida TaxID=3830 RepID=A0AAN9E7C3_CROPI